MPVVGRRRLFQASGSTVIASGNERLRYVSFDSVLFCKWGQGGFVDEKALTPAHVLTRLVPRVMHRVGEVEELEGSQDTRVVPQRLLTYSSPLSFFT